LKQPQRAARGLTLSKAAGARHSDGPEADTDTDTDTDTETDTEAETDTETDTDSEAESDAGGTPALPGTQRGLAELMGGGRVHDRGALSAEARHRVSVHASGLRI
jgi:hypothetical protein